jgi:hypothetical protein
LVISSARALECLDYILKSYYKIKINRKKKVMFLSKDPKNINIKVDDSALKQVPKLKYLGSTFTEDGKNQEDIIK